MVVLWVPGVIFLCLPVQSCGCSGLAPGPLCLWKSGLSLCVLMALCVQARSLGHIQLFAALPTVACLSPLSMGFPSKNTGVGCHSLLQGIFWTQGLHPNLLRLLHYRQILYLLSHGGALPWWLRW